MRDLILRHFPFLGKADLTRYVTGCKLNHNLLYSIGMLKPDFNSGLLPLHHLPGGSGGSRVPWARALPRGRGRRGRGRRCGGLVHGRSGCGSKSIKKGRQDKAQDKSPWPV